MRSLVVLSLLYLGIINTALADEVDVGRLQKNMEELTAIGSRFNVDSSHNFTLTHPEKHEAKIAFIEKELRSYGYLVLKERFKSTAESRLPGITGVNIVAFKKGQSGHTIELGAHYDTAGVAGADDNISGTIGVLEAARVLASTKTSANIRFILYDLEEIGLEGSKHHVKNIAANSSSIDASFVFEMIGYKSSDKNSQHSPIRLPGIFNPPKTGDFTLVVGNLESAYLGKMYLSAAKKTGLKTYDAKRIGGLFKDSARSDHKPYWDNHIPSLLITDTANFRNPHYHKKSDQIDTIDFKFLSQTVATMIETLKQYK